MCMTSTPPFETAKGGQTPHSSRNLQSCEGSLWGVITRSPAPKPGLCGRLSNHSEGEQRAVKLTEGALYVDVASGSCPEVAIWEVWFPSNARPSRLPPTPFLDNFRVADHPRTGFVCVPTAYSL